MKLFRSVYIRTAFVFLAGLAFINMSFVAMEIREFDLAKEYKTLAQLVTNTAGIEEERDAAGESSETSGGAKEVDLVGDSPDMRHSSLYLIVQNKRNTANDSISDLSHLETFCPPPEA